MTVNPVNGHNYTDPVVDKFEDKGLVLGDYAHVFVDPDSKRPTPLEKDWILSLENLLIRKDIGKSFTGKIYNRQQNEKK